MATMQFEEKKREATKKAKQNKRRRAAKKAKRIFLCFLLICSAVLCILSLTVFFNSAEIKVSGNNVYSSEEIIEVSGIELGDNLFLLAKEKISSKIEEKLPFIKETIIEIELPETVVIKIKETSEEVCYVNSKNIFSSDFDGKILKKYEKTPNDLIVITVSDDVKFSIGKNVRFNTNLEKDLVKKYFTMIEQYGLKVNSINLTDPYNSEMIVENRFIVKFGTASELEAKAAHLNAMLKKMPENQSGIIDLRVWSEDKHEAYFTEQSILEYKGEN